MKPAKYTENKITRSFGLDYSNKNLWITGEDKLRLMIGVLGVMLPVMLWFFLWVDSGLTTPLFSISHYYYTRVDSIFILVVGLMGFFLIAYKGYDVRDFIVSGVSGLGAISLLLWPTDNLETSCCISKMPCDHVVSMLYDNTFRSYWHYASAGVFLGGLAYMSLFLFTKSDKSVEQRGKAKRRRNKVYRTCGVVMLMALAVIIAKPIGIISETWFKANNMTFWMEAVAVEAFGISWLVKSEVLRRGKENVSVGAD